MAQGHSKRMVWLAGAAVCSIVAGGPASADGDRQAGRTAPAATALFGGRIWPGGGAPVIESGVLVMGSDGRITAVGPVGRVTVPAGATRVDVSGRTLVPGLINTHGHVGETRGLETGAAHNTAENVAAQLLLYVRYGVTTVASLGGDAAPGFARREAQRRAPHSDARLYVAGPVLAPRTPEDARRDVDRVAATRPDWIKIRVDDNLGTAQKMPEPVYAAVIDQAHRHGLRVAAHMFYLDDAKRLVRAGADLLAHSVRDLAVDDELIALMKGRDICLCPTLMREVQAFVYADTPGFFADPFFVRHADPAVVAALASPARQASVRANRQTALYRQAHGVAAANVRRLAEAGVRIAFGTDTGPPGRFQGYFEHLELEEMAKAGLSTEAVLRSATSDAATCLKTPEIGALRPGALADLLVLARNPLESIANSRTIERVWIGGREVDR